LGKFAEVAYEMLGEMDSIWFGSRLLSLGTFSLLSKEIEPHFASELEIATTSFDAGVACP
jgi:hypothetical protein